MNIVSSSYRITLADERLTNPSITVARFLRLTSQTYQTVKKIKVDSLGKLYPTIITDHAGTIIVTRVFPESHLTKVELNQSISWIRYARKRNGTLVVGCESTTYAVCQDSVLSRLSALILIHYLNEENKSETSLIAH